MALPVPGDPHCLVVTGKLSNEGTTMKEDVASLDPLAEDSIMPSSARLSTAPFRPVLLSKALVLDCQIHPLDAVYMNIGSNAR